MALSIQFMLVALVLAGSSIAPPASGAMLIVPVVPARLGDTVTWATSAGAAILAAGPTDGSLVVFGRRRDLAAIAIAHGSVLLAVPEHLCGSPVSGDDNA